MKFVSFIFKGFFPNIYSCLLLRRTPLCANHKYTFSEEVISFKIANPESSKSKFLLFSFSFLAKGRRNKRLLSPNVLFYFFYFSSILKSVRHTKSFINQWSNTKPNLLNLAIQDSGIPYLGHILR